MLYNECVALFLEYISSYASDSTIIYYRDNLEFFSKYLLTYKSDLNFDICNLTKKDYIGYITYQRKKNVKNTSVRTYSRAIKVFLRYLYNENIINDNITINVKMPYADNRLVVPLSFSDVDNIIRGIEKSPLKERNKLIFALMLCCGLRKSEVINLNISDIDINNRYVKINNSKFNKSRIVPIPKNVYNLIIKYLDIRDSDISALIVSNGQRITDKAINCMFAKLKKYSSKNVYPHLLRHTFATSFILQGGSLEVLRLLLGHSDYNVTRQYIHIATQMSVANIDVYMIDKCFFNLFKYNI